ncbi:MAG: hypothetical protein Q8L91_14650, partial [Polaromonas sp.]|nr:hypothetical protein [Polaromonas sp.]
MNASAHPTDSSTDAPATPPAPQLRVLQPLRLGDPVRWLRAGWHDLMAARGIALFYGLCFWLMAVVLGAVF